MFIVDGRVSAAVLRSQKKDASPTATSQVAKGNVHARI